MHLETSLNDDIDAQFDSARISTNQNSTNREPTYQYSFLFQKLTVDELKSIQKKEFTSLERFERYSGKKYEHVNIDETEMKYSESESRYALLYSFRKTTMLHASIFPSDEWLICHLLFCNQKNRSRRSTKKRTSMKQRKKR